jgi:heat shock protein HtpX
MRSTRVALLLAIPAVAAALVVAVITALIGLPIWLAVLVGIAVGVAVAFVIYARSDAAVAGELATRPVTVYDEPRLHNMVDGLCDSHGFRRPAIAVIDDPGRNAVVWGRRADHANLAVTQGLLDSLNRMELEGLLARELALTGHHGLPAATVLVSLLSLVPGSARERLVAWLLGEHRTVLDDFDAVRLTRYPPGLVAALDKLGQGSTFVRGAKRTSSHLWVAAPTAAGSLAPDTPTIDERIAALREL